MHHHSRATPVIARSEATKQSRTTSRPSQAALDCFAALAMTSNLILALRFFVRAPSFAQAIPKNFAASRPSSDQSGSGSAGVITIRHGARKNGRKDEKEAERRETRSQRPRLAGTGRALRSALASRRSTAALARGTAGPQGSASGHASRDSPERSILNGRPNRGAEILRVSTGVTRAGKTKRNNEALSQFSEHLARRSLCRQDDARAARVRRGRTLRPRAPQLAPPALVTGRPPFQEERAEVLLVRRTARFQDIPPAAAIPLI